MALSPNGKIIASGSGGGDNSVRLWDIETSKVISKWTGHINVVCALCWSADGEQVASGSWDGVARVWDVNTGNTILTIKTRHEWLWAVIYSPDSSKLATGGPEELDAVKIWDAKTGELLNILKQNHWVHSLAWTSDGKKLISGSDELIRIFDTATWQQIAILQGHTSFITVISLSWNNRLLASVSWDKTHEQDLSSAALSPDGKVLVTGCQDGNAYTWDAHAILKEAGVEGLLSIGTNIAFQDDSGPGVQHTPRSSLDNKSFLEADATQCPDQFGGDDELPPRFFDGMEADIDSSPMGGAHPHSSVNTLLAHLSLLLHRLRPENGETTDLPHPSRPSAFHPHALLTRLLSLIHHSPPENDAPDDLQQPSMPSRLDPHILLARLSSLFPRSRLTANEEGKMHPTTPLSSRPYALVGRLSSLFRFQPHTTEEIELTSRPHVVEVAAVRDKKPLVVAQGLQFKKAKRAYEQQIQSHGQAQVSSLYTQFAGASTSAIPPALGPGTTTAGAAAAQLQPIPWWSQIVLFLCCASPPYSNAH
jgi:hypothetical protein